MSVQLSTEWRRVVGSRFDSEWRRLYPDTLGTDHHALEREIFLRTLDGYAEGLATWPESPTLKERKRQLGSASKALGKLVEALEVIDQDALAYVLYLAAKDRDGHAADDIAPIQYRADGDRLAVSAKPILSAMQIATMRAVKSLPNANFKECAAVAQAIHRDFSERRFVFTTSQTSFAAECLAAVFEAADLESTSLQYWLAQGRR